MKSVDLIKDLTTKIADFSFMRKRWRYNLDVILEVRIEPPLRAKETIVMMKQIPNWPHSVLQLSIPNGQCNVEFRQFRQLDNFSQIWQIEGYAMEKLWSSDKSDKSMDLLKSVKSEDLSKDLQVNPRISPQTVKDFMMNGWIE